MISIALFLLGCGASSDTDAGDPLCPCITHEDAKEDVFASAWDVPSGTTDAEKLHYGIGCDKHDSKPQFLGQACSAIEPSSFCSKSWCYVDQRCTFTKHHSTLRVRRPYSYAACGELYLYDDAVQADMELNVVYMSNTDGWKGSYCDEETQLCTGAVAELLTSVLEASGARVRVTKFYGGSSTRRRLAGAFRNSTLQAFWRDHPNEIAPFGACFYATGMGSVDLCIGQSDHHPDRVKVTQTLPLYQEGMILVTKKTEASMGMGDRIVSAFRPFKPALWVACFFFIWFLSVVQAWQEHNHGGDYADYTLLSAFVDASYLGARSFVDAGVALNPTHAGGRFTALGMGFFLLIMISTYTANLATLLIAAPKDEFLVSSWDALLADPTKRLCLAPSLAELVSQHPWNLPLEQVVSLKSPSEIVGNIGSECAGALVSQEDLDQEHGIGKSCDIVRVGEPLWMEHRIAAVSHRARARLQYHLAKLDRRGHWQAILKRWAPPKKCQDKLNDYDDSDAGADVSDLLGPFAISFVFSLIGIIASLCYSRRTRLQRKIEEALEALEAGPEKFVGNDPSAGANESSPEAVSPPQVVSARAETTV